MLDHFRPRWNKPLLQEKRHTTRPYVNTRKKTQITKTGATVPAERNQPDRVNVPKITHLKMSIKIATLNLCLGLQFKKNLVKNFIKDEKIDTIITLTLT